MDEPGEQDLNRDNLRRRIETPQVTRIACHNEVSSLPRNDDHRSIDHIRGVCGSAQFSTGTGKQLIKRNDLYFQAPQEPC